MTTAFTITKEIKSSQNYLSFSLWPATKEVHFLPQGDVLVGYKEYIKQIRGEERCREFPKGVQFVEPTIKLRSKMEPERQMPFPQAGRREISQEKEVTFKPTTLKELSKEKRSFILIADSGMGKTTILKELQYQMVADSLLTEEIPIYFHFRDLLGVFSTEALLQRIKDLFPKEMAKADMEALFEQKRLIFLLDGLDQVEDRSNIPKLLGRYGILSSQRVIVAGRPYIYSSLQHELSHYEYLTLETFSLNQAKAYLGEEVYNDLSHLLKDPYLRAPMLLSILKELGQKMDINRTEIYKKMIERLLDREVCHQAFLSFCISQEMIKNIFVQLSYLLLERGYAGRFPWAIVDSLLSSLNITHGDFARLTHLGVISEVVEGSLRPGSELVFRHQSFQEYLAFIELKKHIFTEDKIIDKEMLKNHLEYNKWDEVIFFLIGALKKEDAKKIISFISHYDFFFAGKCITHYKGDKDKDFKEIIDGLFKQIGSDDAQETLAKIGTNGILKRLIGLLKTDIRWDAASALGKIGSEKAVEYLIPLLEDEDVRRDAASALGKIGSEKAVEYLIPLLEDEDYDVRRDAASVLGKICPEKAVEYLIPLLEDKDEFVRRDTAFALGKIGSEKAVEYLIPLLKDEDVRLDIAFALGEIGSEKAVEYLIPLLKDEDKDVRSGTAFALGKIGSEKAVEYLIPLLKDEDYYVRSGTAFALGETGSEKAVEYLIPLLKDEDYEVRRNTAFALGKIGSEKAVEYLIPLLKDEDVRSSAAFALGKIGSEKAVEYLIPLLKDEDYDVRLYTAFALGEIGSEKAVEYLIPLLKDEYLCWNAALALAKVSKKLKEKNLLSLVKRLHKKGYNKAIDEIKKMQNRRFLRVLYPPN